MEDAGVDPQVSGKWEQIEVDGQRRWITAFCKEGEFGLEDCFEEESCNNWECVFCHYDEWREKDEYENVAEQCPQDKGGCGRVRGLRQRRKPMKWLWKPVSRPVPCDLMDVYDEVFRFLRWHVVLDREEYYDLLTAWVIASWKLHRLKIAPYLLILGTIETGKTRLLEVLNELCYHAKLAVTISPASLARLVDLYSSTILVDQAEKLLRLTTDMGVSLYAISLGGYRRDMTYTVADVNSDGIKSYDVFSLKAFASERIFDTALASRCIILRMHRGRPNNLMIDEGWAGDVRRRLLYYHYLDDEWGEGKTSLDGRRREIYQDLMRIMEAAGRRSELEQVERMAFEEKEKIMKELSTSNEGEVIRYLMKEFKEGAKKVHLADIENLTRVTTQEIGYILKNWRVNRRRDGRGRYVILTDSLRGLIEKLAVEYNVSLEEVEERWEEEKQNGVSEKNERNWNPRQR